jgi:hypothetical protein
VSRTRASPGLLRFDMNPLRQGGFKRHYKPEVEAEELVLQAIQ